jgi:hypothetical protein
MYSGYSPTFGEMFRGRRRTYILLSFRKNTYVAFDDLTAAVMRFKPSEVLLKSSLFGTILKVCMTIHPSD